jgi:hypothetical protein
MGRGSNGTAEEKIVQINFKYKKMTSSGNGCILLRAKFWVVLVETHKLN